MYITSRLFNNTIFFLLLFFPFYLHSESKIYSTNIKEWIEDESSNKKDADMINQNWKYKANRAGYSWKVYNSNGLLKVILLDKNFIINKRKPPKHIQKIVSKKDIGYGYLIQKVDGGWLVSYNNGEYGAELWWYSSINNYSILFSTHHINQFIKLDNVVYAIEGLAHLSSFDGSIIKIINDNNCWIVETLMHTSDTPEAFTIDNEYRMFIAFTNSFGIFTNNNLQIIAKDIWFGFYPNSVIISNDKNKAYIGMRKYICEIDLKSGKIKYLIPNKSFSIKRQIKGVREK